MDQYHQLVKEVLTEGTYKPNRTDVDTIAAFSRHFEIDLEKGFPLLTTKDMGGTRWDSMVHELLWYLSGDAHIRNLREKTGIWDAWADDKGRVDTAYGRFWRRYPIPKAGIEGEAWPDSKHKWVNEDEYTFDQIRYIIDKIKENPESRRLVLNSWHPANASVSTLPPCPYTFVFNVQGNKLNLHLTQRSGDIGLGVPFNIASHSLLTVAVSQETGLEPGKFSHTIVDAHIYCGKNERGEWYRENLKEIKSRLTEVSTRSDYSKIKDWIEQRAPSEKIDGYDHIPGLLLQLSRDPRPRPTIEIADKPLDEIEFEDIQLKNYESAEAIDFKVAE